MNDDYPDAPRVVALLGLRGAGKTTIGKQLARRLHVRFVELDRQIEKAADMSLAELFSLYGEDYYRRLERETLAEVLAEKRPMVLATGGGIVESPDTYALLKKSAVTVWLRAAPEDHWNRVVSQGIGGRWRIIRRRWRTCAPCSPRATRSTPAPITRSTRRAAPSTPSSTIWPRLVGR